MDIMQRQGKYPLPPGVSTILGVEFSGTVEETQGSKWKKGDAVFGLAYGGAYAEYIAVAEGMITKKPEGLSWVKAASIPENWLTGAIILDAFVPFVTTSDPHFTAIPFLRLFIT